MDFSPNNDIVKLCVKSMITKEKGDAKEAANISIQAWNSATNDFEKFIAAYFVARYQEHTIGKLEWLEKALQLALKIDDGVMKSTLPSLYTDIAKCHENLNDHENAKMNSGAALLYKDKIFDKGPFYHGTKADLPVGELLTPGYRSNYDPGITMNHIYFTALANGAGLAAELAQGDKPARVYIVEPTGNFENDPNLTDKKFPGNLTRSYRTGAPLKIVGEVKDWIKQTPEDLQEWGEKLANNKGEIIN